MYIGLLILTADQEMNGSGPQVCILVFLMCFGFIFLMRKNGQMTSRVHRIARRRVRFGTAQQRAYVRARGEGAQAFALARPCSCACSRCSPRSCRPAPHCERGHPWPVPCRGGRARVSLPATFCVLATYAGRASLERARPATTTAPAERPVSRVRGAHDATAVKETGASGLACSTAARHRTARGACCRRGGLRRSRVRFFLFGEEEGRRSARPYGEEGHGILNA